MYGRFRQAGLQWIIIDGQKRETTVVHKFFKKFVLALLLACSLGFAGFHLGDFIGAKALLFGLWVTHSFVKTLGAGMLADAFCEIAAVEGASAGAVLGFCLPLDRRFGEWVCGIRTLAYFIYPFVSLVRWLMLRFFGGTYLLWEPYPAIAHDAETITIGLPLWAFGSFLLTYTLWITGRLPFRRLREYLENRLF